MHQSKKILTYLVFIFIFLFLTVSCVMAKENIYFMRNNDIWLLDLNTNNYKQFTNSGKYYDIVLSPDKTKAAYIVNLKRNDMGGYSGILAASNIDGTGEIIYKDISVFPGQFSWSPDGKKIAVIPETEKLTILDYETGKTAPLEIEAEKIWYPSWSPDGKKIALRASKKGIGDVLIYNTESKDTVSAYESLFKWGSGYFPAPADWTPDSKKIVFEIQQLNNANNKLLVEDLETGEVEQIGEGFSPLFSSKGNMIAFIAFKQDMNQDNIVDLMDADIYIYYMDSKETKNITKSPEPERIVAWAEEIDKILYNQIYYQGNKETANLHSANIAYGTNQELIKNAYGLAWEEKGKAVGIASTTPAADKTETPEKTSKTKAATLPFIIIFLLIAVLAAAVLIMRIKRKNM
ncbi:MAG: hypothetical protein ABIH00_07815 [Armatimonadota bacterium]